MSPKKTEEIQWAKKATDKRNIEGGHGCNKIHVHTGLFAVLQPQSLLWEQLPKCIAAIGYVDRCGDGKDIEAKGKLR
jgi:hypothetical protein